MNEKKENSSTDENVKRSREIIIEKDESISSDQGKMNRKVYEPSKVNEESTDEELIRAIVETLKIIEKDERKIIDNKIKTMQEIIDQEYEERIKLTNRIGHSRKALRFAVCLVMILSLSSMVVNAFGYNFFKLIMDWGESTFDVTVDGEEDTSWETTYDYEIVAKELEDAFKLPEEPLGEFTFDYAQKVVLKSLINYSIAYRSTERYVFYSISLYEGEDLTNWVFEKDDEIECYYEKEGISHYIVSNYDQLQAIWRTDDMVFSINGEVTLDEMKELIDGIYED